jgi:hypothetical protein
MLAACSSSEPRAESAEPVVQAPVAEAEPSAPSHEEQEAEHAEASRAPEPVRTLDDGSRVFGAEPSEREVVALATIMAEPARFEGQVVKTEGAIAQVCQRMGCWMEITAQEGGQAVRVPMAGHSFFLPRDVAGRQAVVEGTVAVAALDEATAEHLRAEGAHATDQALSIEATTVVVR